MQSNVAACNHVRRRATRRQPQPTDCSQLQLFRNKCGYNNKCHLHRKGREVQESTHVKFGMGHRPKMTPNRSISQYGSIGWYRAASPNHPSHFTKFRDHRKTKLRGARFPPEGFAIIGTALGLSSRDAICIAQFVPTCKWNQYYYDNLNRETIHLFK